MITLLRTFAISFAILLSVSAQANDWFKVEVIVFANEDSSGIYDEHWPDINEIPEKPRTVALEASNSPDEIIDGYRKLTGSALSLHGEKNLLRKSGKYRVLYHSGWLQPVAHTQNPRPIRIRAGEILDNGMYELDGYIAVGRGRYLHFRPDLFHSRRLSPAQAEKLNQMHNKSDSTDPENSTTALPSDLNSVTSSAEPSSPLGMFPEIPEVLTVNLNQARRMRSEELHFIDHPLMGVLVEIKPVK